MLNGQKDPFRILLVDHHPKRRKGVSELLAAPHLQIVEHDSIDFLGHLSRLAPDMVILNAEAKDLEGPEVVRSIKTKVPQAKVMILATAKDKEKLKGTLFAGAEGYLLHQDLKTGIPDAIEAIRNGKIYISPSFHPDLTDDWVQACARKQAGLSKSLTARETEVLKLVAEGKSVKEIAGQLFISLRTVEHHRTNIMKKLELKRSADLIRYAICKGTP